MNTLRRFLKDLRAAGATLYRHGSEVMLDPTAPRELHEALAEHHDDIAAAVVPSVTPEQREQVSALLSGYDVILVADPADCPAAVAQLLTDAADSGAVALDTETAVVPEYRAPVPVAINRDGTTAKRQPKDGAAGYALDPRRARVRLLQAHAGGRAIYLFDMDAVPWGAVTPLFTDAPAVAMFNAVFDLKMIAASGGPEPAVRVFDTQTAMRLLTPCESWPIGMGEAAGLLLDVELPKGLGAADWSGELDGDMVRYAAADPLVTFALWQEQRARLDEIDEASQEITDECLLATARMELAGLPHDDDAHRAFIDAVERELVVAVTTLADATDGALPGDPTAAELGAYLERVLADETLDAWPRTAKTGALATDKVTLSQDYAAEVPGVRELLTVRQWTKALSTYGPSLLERADDDGRIYARFMVAGARTGRYSCREPNLQQLPKRGKHELLATFRRVVRAPEGRTVVAADYSQIELRIAAAISGDETMGAAFANNADVHLSMAQNLAGATWDALDDAERKRQRGLAKAANFGLIYGSGPAAFARSATANGTPVTEDEAADIIETWRATYPGLWDWQQEQSDRTRTEGYVQTIGGRRWFWEWRALHPNDRRLDDLEDYQVPDAIAGFERNYSLNHPIQGAAAEVMAVALSYADRALRDYDARICAVVHDELVLDVADDPITILSVAGILQVQMTRAWMDFFPDAPWRGLVDVGWGPTWADAH